MKQTTNQTTIVVMLVVLSALSGWILTGCESSSTGPTPGATNVSMSVMFSKAGVAGLRKGVALSADSLRIDSAVVVFSRIKFLSHADSVQVDSGEVRHDSSDNDSSTVFRGPFVVHIEDTLSIDFVNHPLPAGSYDGIKFKIHPLGLGEEHDDIDKHSHHEHMNDSMITGSSLMVWGAVYKSGAWTNFAFALNEEIEFKVKGNFVVPATTSTVKMALNINLASWFKNPSDGSLLDPTDLSSSNRHLIREAIAAAFGGCKGGHDRGDGHPDH